MGEGKKHYEVNSSNGVNSYHGVERTRGSRLYISSSVNVAIISVKDRLVLKLTLKMASTLIMGSRGAVEISCALPPLGK